MAKINPGTCITWPECECDIVTFREWPFVTFRDLLWPFVIGCSGRSGQWTLVWFANWEATRVQTASLPTAPTIPVYQYRTSSLFTLNRQRYPHYTGLLALCSMFRYVHLPGCVWSRIIESNLTWLWRTTLDWWVGKSRVSQIPNLY